VGKIEFKEIDSLLAEIVSDKKTTDILSNRFPIRLIFLQRFETFRDLIEKLSAINVEIYHIEKDLPSPDGWITKDALFDIVTNLQKSTAIVPFSEIVRFYSQPDFQNLFNRLLLIENTSDKARRIYLPLIGVEQRFEREFYQKFSRRNECAPIWSMKYEEPNSISVILSNSYSQIKLENREVLKSCEEWLKFWKKQSPCDVVCFSKPLNHFFKNTLPDTIFSIEQATNPKELLEKVIEKDIPIAFIESEMKYWEDLIPILSNDYQNLGSLVKKHFKVTDLTTHNLLDFWLKTDNEFHKWLLKHYILSQSCLKETYLFKVLTQLDDLSDHNLLKGLYMAIFDVDDINVFINERFDLISQYSKNRPIILCDEALNELDKKLRGLTDTNQALLLITGLFSLEKSIILELISNSVVINHELLLKSYPDISFYLSPTSFENLKKEQNWVYEYLNEYKSCKLKNVFSEKLKSLITDLNGNQNTFYNWYHSFDSIHNILHSNNIKKIIFIDALGIEWCSFIESYLVHKGSDLRVIKNYLGVSNLPSSTELNRIEADKYLQDFDLFIHTNLYSYPNSIINEFNLIKRIIDSNFILDSNQTVAIVADHGLTSLSRLVDSKKYGKNDSHEGRYIETDNKDHSVDSDYLIYKSEIDNKNYLIALKHNSLGKKPIREVHGGCTPEEVLVPFIILSNTKNLSDLDYSILLDKTEISKKEPFIRLQIEPKPRIARIQIGGKTQNLIYNELTENWEAKVDKSLSGKVSFTVLVEETKKSYTINIKSGIIEEELF